jgi:hypothetical protein
MDRLECGVNLNFCSRGKLANSKGERIGWEENPTSGSTYLALFPAGPRKLHFQTLGYRSRVSVKLSAINFESSQTSYPVWCHCGALDLDVVKLEVGMMNKFSLGLTTHAYASPDVSRLEGELAQGTTRTWRHGVFQKS